MRIETRHWSRVLTDRDTLLVGAFLALAMFLGSFIAKGQLDRVVLICGGVTVALAFGWIVRRPYLGLAAFIVYQFAIPTAQIEDHPILGRLGLLLALATFGLFAFGRLVSRDRVTITLPKPVEWAGLLFLTGLTLATAINGEQHTPAGVSSWALAGEFYRSALLSVLFLLTVRSLPALQLLVRILLAASLLYALYGLLPGVSGVYRGEEGPGRVTGLHHDPNYYAFYLVFPVLLALTYLVRRSGRDRWLSIAVVAIGGLAIIQTYSRGAWLSVIGGLGYLLLRDRFRWRTLLIGIVVAALVTGLFGGIIVERFEGVGDLEARSNSLVSRLYAANAGWRMFTDHSVAGVGLGEFKSHVVAYGNAFLHGQMQIGAHNTYVQLLAETGVLGGGAYIVFLLLTLSGLRRATRKLRSAKSPMASWVLGLEVATVGIFIGMSSLSLGSHYREWIFLSLAIVALRLVDEWRDAPSEGAPEEVLP
ncbi:MAG: O-antigen ligase family protein [Planctomycetota bacterium]